MDRMQSGGGMPDMNDLMQDPALRNLYVPRPSVSSLIFLTSVITEPINLEGEVLDDDLLVLQNLVTT